jgi:hypothetical protein
MIFAPVIASQRKRHASCTASAHNFFKSLAWLNDSSLLMRGDGRLIILQRNKFEQHEQKLPRLWAGAVTLPATSRSPFSEYSLGGTHVLPILFSWTIMMVGFRWRLNEE